ncbi:hypothetical protein AB0948_27030 [Streptomyces koyangensis]|uniref:hypothetical protein n=1 Tax=Streptomyces koyangensis TaxID=188770 RepID=UPI0034571BE7
MPTYEVLPRFAADLDRLFEQQCCFHRAVTAFVQDLRGGGHFRAGLREARGFAYSWRGQPLNPRVVTPLSRERGRVRLSLQGCAGCQG